MWVLQPTDIRLNYVNPEKNNGPLKLNGSFSPGQEVQDWFCATKFPP